VQWFLKENEPNNNGEKNAYNKAQTNYLIKNITSSQKLLHPI
jgi:hypothetical protein